jgi:hypothetical protein
MLVGRMPSGKGCGWPRSMEKKILDLQRLREKRRSQLLAKSLAGRVGGNPQITQITRTL